MKRNLLALIGTVTLLSVSFAAQKSTIYMGEIMDSRCAQLGSHNKVRESNHTKSADDCSVACVKSGATFVLVDEATNAVYQLDDQKKPRYFAGLKVNVTGTLDKATATIRVKGIDKAPGSASSGW